MVLLTAVPVSAPASMVTGVMVATGAPPVLAAAMGGAAAVGGAPASPPAVGASEAVMSPLSPPNRLSMSEQAARPRPAVSAKARNRPLLSPCVAGIPLIILSDARRYDQVGRLRNLAPKPNPGRSRKRVRTLVASLTQQGGREQGSTLPLWRKSASFHRDLAGIGVVSRQCTSPAQVRPHKAGADLAFGEAPE